MAKAHLNNRIDETVLKMADNIAARISEESGVTVSQGAAVEKAVKALYAKMFPVKPPKQKAKG